jgi:TetR/AcrR family transcriptional regulator, transcriptional repressor for nem operon
MARPREFDTDAVRQRLAGVFATHGYSGTSMALLSQAAGLGKQSLYNAFGDKKTMYLQAVQQAGSGLAPTAQAMALAPTGLQAVQLFFSGLLGVCLNPNPAINNCIVSAGLLEGVETDAVADELRSRWAATEALLRKAVARGQRDGSVRADVPAAELAQLLMTLTSGLRVSARALQNKRQLAAVAALGLKVLEPA